MVHVETVTVKAQRATLQQRSIELRSLLISSLPGFRRIHTDVTYFGNLSCDLNQNGIPIDDA